MKRGVLAAPGAGYIKDFQTFLLFNLSDLIPLQTLSISNE